MQAHALRTKRYCITSVWSLFFNQGNFDRLFELELKLAGDIAYLNKEGSVQKTIALPTYRRPTYEEIDEMEKKRNEDIIKANREFDNAKRELRSLLTDPHTPDSDIILKNRDVENADTLLQSIRFPLRYVATLNVYLYVIWILIN